MLLNVRSTTAARRLGVMTFAAAMAAATVGLGAGVVQAAPGDKIPIDCVEGSTDGGVTWTGMDDFKPERSGYIPIPGDEGVQFAFDVRNTCDVPAKLVLYSQNWSVADGGTATVRGAIDGVKGEQIEIGPGKDSAERIVLKEKAMPQDEEAALQFLLGIPRGETVQGNQIDGGFGFEIIEVAPDQAAPSAPTDLSASGATVEKGKPVTISGMAEPGSTVIVSGGGQTCETTADEAGAFSCELTFGSDGAKTITATAANDNGTSAPSESITVTVTDDSGEGGGSGSLGSLGSGSLGSLDLFGSLGLK